MNWPVPFTQPVIISTRFFDGTVECACGCFIVLNEEGWILTVAHLWESNFAFKHAQEITAYNAQRQAILEDEKLAAKQKRKKMSRLQANPRWITNHSFWWCSDGVVLKDVRGLPEGDLVIGRLEPFDPKKLSAYPVLKDSTSNFYIGTSLCKLGFPFHKIKATFDDAKNMFELAPGSIPLPLFPLEGIYTRNVAAGKSKDGKYELKFLETSTPGLRGQSGGPIFDRNGTVWAMQSKTAHFPLGFGPKIQRGGKEVEENQFLNVGWGVHAELVVAFLRDNGVRFEMSTN